MTPEAIRTVSQLRQEFYTGFAAAMGVPVKVNQSNSYASNISMASWLDQRQRFNYVCIYAHLAPDELVPERPLILRLAINQGAGIIANSKRGKGCQGLNQRRRFELTLLPEEILDFLPWMVQLAQARNIAPLEELSDPPYPLHLKTNDFSSAQSIWTQKADRQYSKQDCSMSMSH